MSDDARAGEVASGAELTAIFKSAFDHACAEWSRENDRLRARVAELETAGDRVIDLVDGESNLPGVVRDVVDDLQRAVRRGER